MTAEVQAGNYSIGEGYPGSMFQRKMDHNSNLHYPPLQVETSSACAEHETGTVTIKNAMSYRGTPRPPQSPTNPNSMPKNTSYDSYLDDGPESPPLPKFDYNNDRIQNDLLQEICSDIGIKDAMELDFFDFDQFEEKKYNMNDDDACLDQVIPFGELQHQEDALATQRFSLPPGELVRVKDDDPGMCSGVATGAPSPMGSPTIQSGTSASYEEGSAGPSSNRSEPSEQNVESPLSCRPKSEPVFINSPHSNRLLHRSQSSGSPIGSPAHVPSVGSPKAPPVESPKPAAAVVAAAAAVATVAEQTSCGQALMSPGIGMKCPGTPTKDKGIPIKQELLIKTEDVPTYPVNTAVQKAPADAPAFQSQRPLFIRTATVPYRLPGIQESPNDQGYYSSMGSSVQAVESHCGSVSAVSAMPRSISPPGNLELQSVNDKVQTYLDQNVPSSQYGQCSRLPIGSMPAPSHMGAPQGYSQPRSFRAHLPVGSETRHPCIPGNMTGPRMQSPTKVGMSPACQMGPPTQAGYQHPSESGRGPSAPYQSAQECPPGGELYAEQLPPSVYHAQRSGSQPTSPKKRRQEMEDLMHNYGATPQQPPMMHATDGAAMPGSCQVSGQFTTPQPRMQLPPGGVSTPSFMPGAPMRLNFAGQPIKDSYVQCQQVKRTSSYRERISPEKPPILPGQVPNEPPITKIPPVTQQNPFIQNLINDKSNAFRSHPLFPLLRDLIIADMNFYSPQFPFGLIANLPKDFDSLLRNFLNRNPQSNSRRTNTSVDNVVLDALRYAHKALIEKIQQRRKDLGQGPDKAVSVIEDFCERFDKAIKNNMPKGDTPPLPPTSTSFSDPQQGMPQPQVYPQQPRSQGSIGSAVPPALSYQAPGSQFTSPAKRRYLHSTRTQSPSRSRRELLGSPVPGRVDLTDGPPTMSPGYQASVSIGVPGQYGHASGPGGEYPGQQMGGPLRQNAQVGLGGMTQQNRMWNVSHAVSSHQNLSHASSHQNLSHASSHQNLTDASSHQNISHTSSNQNFSQANSQQNLSHTSSHQSFSHAGSHLSLVHAGSQQNLSHASSHQNISQATSHQSLSHASSHPNLSLNEISSDIQNAGMVPTGHDMQPQMHECGGGGGLYSASAQNASGMQVPYTGSQFAAQSTAPSASGYESPLLNSLPYQAPTKVSQQPSMHVACPVPSDGDRPPSRGSSNGSSHGNDSNGSSHGHSQVNQQGGGGGKRTQVLPKEAVTIMLEWLRAHQEKPYPSDEEKELLMSQTGLAINQINYWFTNARRRILPKWTLQRILEEQARANGEDPASVKVKGSAQEARAVTKELLKGNTLETFLNKAKTVPPILDQFVDRSKAHLRHQQMNTHRHPLPADLHMQGQVYNQVQIDSYQPYTAQADRTGMAYGGPSHYAQATTGHYNQMDSGLGTDYSPSDGVSGVGMMHNMSNSTLNASDLGLLQ